MTTLVYDMLYNYRRDDAETTRLATMHPKQCMRELGITYGSDSESKTYRKIGDSDWRLVKPHNGGVPQASGHQWVFLNCKNIPDKLPPFITSN